MYAQQQFLTENVDASFTAQRPCKQKHNKAERLTQTNVVDM